jgi:uncharacterized protein (TIGR03435 family)
MVCTMTRRVYLPQILARRVLAGIAICAICAVAGLAQSPQAEGNALSKPPAYEVVSIRPHKDNGNYSHWWTPTPDGYAAYNVQVFDLIFNAYELTTPGQVVGLPKWGYEDSFDIEAKVDEETLPAYQKLSDRERKTQAAPMLRTMLADRFNLKVHHETRILPVYALVVAKGGFKLKQSQAPEALYGMVTGQGRITIRGGPIGARFIVGLSNATGRIVVDKTSLTGYYDIDLKWTPDEDLAAGASGPSLFTALEEQLGLKLISEKAPVDVLVVDRIEKPSAN